MKILLVVHCFYPKHIFGTETLTLEIAHTLQKLNHEVHVLTTDSHLEEANGRKYVNYSFENIPVTSLDTLEHPITSFRETYCRDNFDSVMDELIKEIQPDLIHCVHTMNFSVSFLKGLQNTGIPVVATLTDFFGICFNCKLQRHDSSFCKGPDFAGANCLECYFAQTKNFQAVQQQFGVLGKLVNSPKRLAYALKWPQVRELPMLQEVRSVVERKKTIQEHYEVFRKMAAPTNFLKQTYIQNGYPGGKIEKLTFGLNQDLLQGFQEARTDFSAPLTIGYIGQIYWHKGVDVLVKAFNQLANPDMKLKLFGNFAQDESYTNLLRELKGENQNIEFHGTFPRSELGSVLNQLDVLVIPSLWYENAPLVMLNALATRTPVIISNVDGMNEFIRHGENGLIVETGSVEDLAKCLQLCAESPDLLQKISRNASYSKSIDDYVEELLAIYQDCLV